MTEIRTGAPKLPDTEAIFSKPKVEGIAPREDLPITIESQDTAKRFETQSRLFTTQEPGIRDGAAAPRSATESKDSKKIGIVMRTLFVLSGFFGVTQGMGIILNYVPFLMHVVLPAAALNLNWIIAAAITTGIVGIGIFAIVAGVMICWRMAVTGRYLGKG